MEINQLVTPHIAQTEVNVVITSFSCLLSEAMMSKKIQNHFFAELESRNQDSGSRSQESRFQEFQNQGSGSRESQNQDSGFQDCQSPASRLERSKGTFPLN